MKEIEFKVLIPGQPFKSEYGGFGYCSVSLIKDENDIILFDVGHYAVRAEIKKILNHNKINKVFISHLHYDHCLNLDLFLNKNIKIYIHENEFKYLNNVKKNDIYTFRFLNKIITKRDIVLYDKEFNISKNVSILHTFGHTIGHSSLVFKKGIKKYILAGDAIKTYNDYKDIYNFDMEPYNRQQLINTKKEIIKNFDIIIPGHSNIIIDGKKPKNSFKIFEF